MINKQTVHQRENKEAQSCFKVTERKTDCAAPLIICHSGLGCKRKKYLALSSWCQGAGASLVQVGTLGDTGPLMLVQVYVLGRGSSSRMLMHICALVTQPLVAQCTQTLSKCWFWALWAALTDTKKPSLFIIQKTHTLFSQTHIRYNMINMSWHMSEIFVLLYHTSKSCCFFSCSVPQRPQRLTTGLEKINYM